MRGGETKNVEGEETNLQLLSIHFLKARPVSWTESIESSRFPRLKKFLVKKTVSTETQKIQV